MKLDELVKLPPWLRYPLVALIERHLLSEEMRLILGTQLGQSAPESGEVPGRPGWVYQPMWGGYFVSNQALLISLDVKTGEPPVFERFLAMGMLLDQMQREEPVHDSAGALARWRTCDWVLGMGPVAHVIDELIELGALVSLPADRFRIEESLVEECGAFSSLADDPQLFDRLFPDGDEEDEWDAWYARLLEIAADPKHDALVSVHEELDDEEVESIVWGLLQKPGEGLPPALEVASKREVDLEAEVVTQLIQKVDVRNGDAVRALARYALPRGIATELMVDKLTTWAMGADDVPLNLGEGLDEELQEMLAISGADTMSGGVMGLEEAATLLLEHAPEHALPVARRALRKDSTGSLLMACRLAAIGQSWATRELVEAIPEFDAMMRQTIISLLESRGFTDVAEAARKADPDKGSLGMLGLFESSGIDMKALQGAAQSVTTDQNIVKELDVWAERVRDGLPADFDPSS